MTMLLFSILWVVNFISFLICLVTYFFIKQTDGVVYTIEIIGDKHERNREVYVSYGSSLKI